MNNIIVIIIITGVKLLWLFVKCKRISSPDIKHTFMPSTSCELCLEGSSICPYCMGCPKPELLR